MRVLLLALLAVQLMAVENGHMRWRVFSDTDSETSFRFPYDYRMPDQYRGVLMRPDRQFQISYAPGQKPSNEQVQDLIHEQYRRAEDPCIGHVWLPRAELPDDMQDDDLPAVFRHLSQHRITEVQAFDYYERENLQRPFARRSEAARGVSAVRGSGPQHCGQLLKTRDGYAMLLLRGSWNDANNRAILDSFEVQPRPGYTWRALQSSKGQVIDANGQALSVRQVRNEDVDWAGAWEAETRHYHLTCSVSAEKTLYYAALLESLYDTYAGVFRPESEPDFKIEVHVMHDETQYQQVLRGLGVNVASGMIGLFFPELLGMFLFDDTSSYAASAEGVLAHESSHHFLHVTCNGSAHVPTWINEGLAVYFEAGDYGPGKARWQAPMDRLQRLKSLYQQTGQPLQPLQNYLGHYEHIDTDQYGEVYAMTHFWVFGSSAGRERFRDYWQALKTGENGTDAFERIFMQDLIRSHGSREAACRVWADALVRYVLAGKPERK